MKQTILLFWLAGFIGACSPQPTVIKAPEALSPTDVQTLNQFVDKWHRAASDAKFDDYFGAMADSSIFIGTDAGERWTKEEFMNFARPFFERGKAWSFRTIGRNWNPMSNSDVAWFDETLDTWMGVCRSTGVVCKTDSSWKISHYQLSVTVPNDKIKPFISLMNDSSTTNTAKAE